MRQAPGIPLPGPLVTLLRGVVEEAERLGLELALVGGAVRDLLLGLTASDIDISVGGPPESVFSLAAALAERYASKPERHEPFGTASLPAPLGGGEVRLDLAMRRKEFYPRPAALPVVEPGSWAEDLARRDFTLNGLAWLLPRGGAGRASDAGPAGDAWILRREDLLAAPLALDDLDSGLLRVFHRESFTDDPTRLFRGARLAVRLGFSFAPETWEMARSSAPVVALLSPARVGNEIRLTAQEPQSLGAFALLDQLGVWEQLLPSWNAQHPRPDSQALAEGLRLCLADRRDAWLAALLVWLAAGLHSDSARETTGAWVRSLGWPSRDAAPLAAGLTDLRRLEEALDSTANLAAAQEAISTLPAAVQAALYARGDARRRSALAAFWAARR